MSDKNSAFPLMISVVVMDAAQLAAVYALLAGAAPVRVSGNGGLIGVAGSNTVHASVGSETLAPENPASAGTGPSATTVASPSEDSGEIDAHGWPWSADMHAATKSKTKDGLWRMKVAVQRPDPKPGFPKEDAGTGTSQGTDTNSATDQVSAPAATSAPEEEDEFAAFREAAAASDAADEAAAAAVPERQYSDADLGALCNQAAVKLGDPSPIKEIIASYVPEGQVAHSRNIPTDKRAEFVKAVEAKAGIEFAG